MRHDIPANGEPLTSTALGDADEQVLRAEIARLQRENRALTIALAEMERVAERDMLTPLFNRRYFLSALHQRIARTERFGDRIALVYVDVDNLKQINDTHGHGAGDFALIEIAARLAAAMRPCDVLARIGGDEFGILLDHVSQIEAAGKMRRLKAIIEDEPCHYEGQAMQLGAAFGLAMITPGQSAEDLVGRADAAMYRNKRG
ncbi:GGDEF domain-containing protein [Sphingomonas lacunae]|uniref:diguanylate cyclase n=1 Tax=Sphingomonas lacunae TaxID=2698828 RepID=A0A6M4AQZ5_9SPHN|nr:GGDEF domain-containing protein [Sphingomonas lacunae]QJQ31126.1 GGDEF domain-containing protein [Sphingomonas lacunae]